MRISDLSSDVCSSDLSENPDCPASAVPATFWRGSFGGAWRWFVPDTCAGGRIQPLSCPCRKPGCVPRKGSPALAYRGSHAAPAPPRDRAGGRSEEHTSGLQSLMRISYAVFCLKKKKQ